VVEREAESDIAPSVMPGESKSTVAERVHDHHHVPRDGALGILTVVRSRCRSKGAAVATEVGADNRETSLDELRGDSMPRGGGPRVSMQ
jgi:hypothetical protein